MVEKDVRDPSVKYAKSFGDVMHWRMHFGHGVSRGWPDDLFVFKDGHHWWVEFKRPGGEATPLQIETHKKLGGFMADVSVIDDEEDFKVLFDRRRSRAKLNTVPQ